MTFTCTLPYKALFTAALTYSTVVSSSKCFNSAVALCCTQRTVPDSPKVGWKCIAHLALLFVLGPSSTKNSPNHVFLSALVGTLSVAPNILNLAEHFRKGLSFCRPDQKSTVSKLTSKYFLLVRARDLIHIRYPVWLDLGCSRCLCLSHPSTPSVQ